MNGIPKRMSREIADHEIGLLSQLGRLAEEIRANEPNIQEVDLADRMAQRMMFHDCGEWVDARRAIRGAGPTLGLDS